MSYTWTGTATCRHCGKTAALRLGNVCYDDVEWGAVRLDFEMPKGWLVERDYCSRRCAMQADLQRCIESVQRLTLEIERENQSGESLEDHGQPS